MPLWARNDSGGSGYNQSRNNGYGYNGQNASAGSMFGFGNRGMHRQNGSYGNQPEPNSRSRGMNQGNNGYNTQRGFGFGARQQQQQSPPYNMQNGSGNRQQFQQQYQQPFQQQFQQQFTQPNPGGGMPPNMQNGFGEQQYQQPAQGMGMPPNIPAGFDGQQQQSQSLQGITPPNAQTGSTMQEQYEAINRDLPDGVKIYPLDMKNLPMSLAGFSKPADTAPASPLPTPAPAAPPQTQPAREHNPYTFIEKIIQNEQNGAQYYRNLSTLAPTSEMQEIINDFGSDCVKRKDAFAALYSDKTANTFSPADPELNDRISFHDGILFAIKEESKTLRELGESCEKAADEKISALLACRIYRKISDLSLLHYINSKLINGD